MTRDWLLTLLVMSPFLLTAAVVVLVLTRMALTQIRRRTSEFAARPRRARDGADQMEEANQIPS